MAKTKTNNNEQSLLLPIFAIISVILFIALCWYAYNNFITSSKKQGAVYIKADKSPIKIKPTDPGGIKVDHKDKQIFNTLNGSEEKVGNNIKVIKEEQAVNKLKSFVQKDIKTLDSLIEESYKSEEKKAQELAATTKTIKSAVKLNQKSADIANLTAKKATIVKETETKDANITTKRTDNGTSKTKITFKNIKKPALVQAKKTTTKASPVSTKGSYFVQIGAYGTKSEAENSWKTYSRKLGSAISKYKHRVDKAVVKGKTYHRLSFGGFGTKRDAANKCVSIKKRGINCLVKKY